MRKIEAPPAANGEAVVTRVFDAPREAVWKAWTEPAQFSQWWGPMRASIPECQIDLRVGGRYLLCERSTDGSSVWVTGTYREIVPPERLVTTLSFADSRGKIVPSTHYGMLPGLPLEMLVTVTFEARGSQTVLTVRQANLLKNRVDAFAAGWNEALDKLIALLKRTAR